MALNIADEAMDFYEFEPYLPVPLHTPPPPRPPPQHNVETALLAAAVVSFIFLISKDAHKAFTRRAHWIPCDFLVLSACSIQLLNLLSAQNEALGMSSNMKLSIKAGADIGVPDTLWKEFLMIHNSRTILCVLVAYVMPGMANRGPEHSWGRLVALAISILQHVTSELYIEDSNSNRSLNYLRLWPRQNGLPDPVYFSLATTISLCFVMLVLLLGSANIAGRSIERIVAKKISLVVRGEEEFCSDLAEKTQEAHPHPHPHHHPHHHFCWRTVKEAILRAKKRKENPHHHHHHDRGHSCWQTVKAAILEKENEDHLHSCWRTVEDAVLRVEKREENQHSCWQTVEDAFVRGEEHHRRHCHYCWKTVEDAVLKAWIIVRAYSLQHVISRSALTSSAAIIVSIQIVTTIVGGLAKGVNTKNIAENKFKFIATVLQCIFIFIGWAVIIWRWASAVAYYRKGETESWRSCLRIEDFWTRHLRELQKAKETRLPQAQSLDIKVEQLVAKEKITLTVPNTLLSALIVLQWLLVSFSKACWFASLMLFKNKLMGKLLSLIFPDHEMYTFEDYPKYKKILQDVQLFGESPEGLWVANRKSIERARNLILQGGEDGEYNCEHLVEFLSTKRTAHRLGLRCLEPYKPQTGLNFLCKKRPTEEEERIPMSDVENQQSRGGNESLAVEDVSRKSWKMTAVSLLTIIVQLSPICAEIEKKYPSTSRSSTSSSSPPKFVKDCLDAYSQAWEIIDFVEEADIEDDGITSETPVTTSEAADRCFQALQKKMDNTSEAADRCFQALKKKMHKGDFSASESTQATPEATPECVRAALEKLKTESKSKTEPPRNANILSGVVHALAFKRKKEKVEGRSSGWNGNDSMDWQAAALGSAVYKLCNSIQCNDGVNELLKELESSLADIINECLEKVQHLLLLNSRKWALRSDEKRMAKALYTAGKAKVIMEKLEENELAIVSDH